MPIDEQQKSNLVTSFTALVRQAQLPGVEVQRIGMAFRMALDVVEPDQPIDLASLHEFLVQEQKVPQQASLELCVILKSREERLGVVFTVPPGAQMLPASEVERIVGAYNARLGASWEKKAPEPVKPPPGAPAPSSAPLPARRQASGRGRTVVLGGLFAASLAGAAGFFAWRQANMGPPLVEIHHSATAPGLPCSKLVVSGPTAICDVSKALVDADAPETLRAKARLTRDHYAPQGVRTVLVRLEGSGKIVLTAP